MRAVLLKGSGSATERDPLHDRCIGVTAALRYDTIARGSRIKFWRSDIEGYMSDSAAMLPSANGIHHMAAIVLRWLPVRQAVHRYQILWWRAPSL